MSIASEITRLQGAKADLATAIEGKGVTVPSATKLDGYADLVDAISQGGGGGTMQSKSVSYTPSTSAQSQTVTADAGYDGLSSVAVSVAAMPSGTEGTPTATKGTVSNHSIAVTPSVTNSAGYIEGGTKTGEAVTVSASDVTSGYQIKTANGTYDVTNLASLIVNVPNSYTASDEGKVVSSGALVAQTAHADVTPTTSDQTIDTTTNNSLKVKGDADLIAGNIKKDVDIFGVTGTYEGSGGGGDATAFIEGTLSGSYTNSDITEIRSQAFRKYNAITSVSCPNVTTIGAEAFRDNTGITSVSFPKVTTLGGTVFYGCTALTSVFLPLATSFSAYAFQGCTSLQTAVGPVAGEISDNVFYGCTNLLSADGLFDPIRGGGFSGCTKLGLLVIRRTSLCRLFNINAFQNTKFASGKAGGDIYIPKSLYDHLGDGTSLDYKAASNWSTLDGYGTVTWHAIEGSYYETHYVDGTVIS